MLALVAWVGLLAHAAPAPAQAEDAVKVTAAPTPENKFPTEVTFSVDANSSAGEIADVQLKYTLLPTGTLTSDHAEFDKGATVHAVYHLRIGGNRLYLPPTKVIRYYWEITDSAGNATKTDPVDWMYQDTRFKFKSVTSGNLTLFYYTGADASAQRILSIGRAALDKAAQLDGVTIDFSMHLVTYGTRAEVADALSHESPSTDPNVLGQANAPDIVVLVAGDLRGAENEDTVRHELTHLVNSRAVEGRQTMPLWLDEGLAVFGQQDPGGFADAVRTAIRRDAVVPLRGLTPGFRGSNADLFYGEAWSVVNFLVKTYGPEKLAQLLAQFKGVVSEDTAFQNVYGLNRDGVYNAWRESVGLRAVATTAAGAPARPAQNSGSAAAPAASAASGDAAAPSATSAGAASRSNAAPTQPPAPAPKVGSRSSASGNSGDDVMKIVLAAGGAAAFLALLVVAVFGGLALSRRGRV